MSRAKGLLGIDELEVGHIIEFAPQGSVPEKRKKLYKIGYAFRPGFDAQNNDQLDHIDVFPIVELETAQEIGTRYYPIHADIVGSHIGLDVNKNWAMILLPMPVKADANNLAQRPGFVYATGLLDKEAQINIEDAFMNAGVGDRVDQLGREFGTGIKQANHFGLYAPVGIKGNKDPNADYGVGFRKGRPEKHKVQGKVLDIDIDNAVKAGIIEEDVANLFTHPEDKRVSAITSLRQVWAMADKNPEALEKYIPKKDDKAANTNLKIFGEDKLHQSIAWGFSEPKNPKITKPIFDLQSAYELVTQRPEDMNKYKYIGVATQAKAIVQIPAIYEEITAQSSQTSTSTTDLGEIIKKAWSTLGEDYLSSTQSGVPEQYLDDNSNPMWKLVTRQPG